MGTFSIEIENLEWINGSKDDPEDLCLHGKVVAYIGKVKLEYDATVSATALYLLKTLTEDHIINTDNQMLPCCGFFYIPNEELDNVVISGCDNGIDWSVIHDGDNVILELDDGTKESVFIEDYREAVYDFADKVEAFYKSCSPKVIPKDDFERDGYLAFWNEWHRRRGMIEAIRCIELQNHIKISYFERGLSSGIPVILLHGLADSWHVFEPLIQYLPKSMHIFSMSLRGHGDSSCPDSGFGTRDFEEDLFMFMDSQNIEKAVILGASSGGFPARNFAVNHPERTVALVLLGSPATLQGIPSVQEVWDSGISKLTDPVDVEFVYGFARSTLSKAITQEFLEMMLKENLKLPARVWRDTTEGIMKEEFPGQLDKISSPTLIIWGDQDKLLTRRSQEELARVIPDSKLVVHENAGHMLYCEDPEGVASYIATFIEEIQNKGLS